MQSGSERSLCSPSATEGDCWQTAVAAAKVPYCFEPTELLKVLHVCLMISQASYMLPYSATIDSGLDWISYCLESYCLTFSLLF